VVVADVNNDGIPDLVTADHEGNNVSVLLGNGDGTFQAARNFATGNGPQVVRVGDFNGDGIPDLVTAETGSNTVSVLLGNGDGSFQAPISQSVGHHPYFMAPGDFDGDGRLDLAVVNYRDGDLLILLGNGDGTFRPGPDYPVGFAPTSVVAADLQGDGRLDLVVTNKGDPYGNGGVVSVFAGNGDGTFQAPVSYAAGLLPWSVAVADFNGDGVPDLAVANRGSHDVSVLLGNGDGTFQPAQVPSSKPSRSGPTARSCVMWPRVTSTAMATPTSWSPMKPPTTRPSC
jgi:hypothetical protein